jgi:hypothetical protein
MLSSSTTSMYCLASSPPSPSAPHLALSQELCSTVTMPTIPMDEFKAAIINGGPALSLSLSPSLSPSLSVSLSLSSPAGYRVSQYHNEAGAVKTDAPNAFIWDIIKAFKLKYTSPPAWSSL